MYYNINNI